MGGKGGRLVGRLVCCAACRVRQSSGGPEASSPTYLEQVGRSPPSALLARCWMAQTVAARATATATAAGA